MTPREYVEYRDRLQKCIDSLEEDISKAYDEAASCPLPERLRRATPADITIGNVIWYSDNDPGSAYWCVVEEVLFPDDDWKAYTWLGARYGLHNAYVEVTA